MLIDHHDTERAQLAASSTLLRTVIAAHNIGLCANAGGMKHEALSLIKPDILDERTEAKGGAENLTKLHTQTTIAEQKFQSIQSSSHARGEIRNY